MSEKVNTYLLDNPYELLAMDRKEFYDEQLEISLRTGEPSRAVEVVNVLLFNMAGVMILQKRSSLKKHNPNLLDKAIGGHIVHGDDANYTVMVETIQELQVPSLVLESRDDFLKSKSLLKNYLQTIALVEKIGVRLMKISKVFQSETAIIANKTHVYIGVYNGSVKNVDHEAKGILFYSLEELEEEMQKFPDMFTQDLHYYMKEYRENIYSFRNEILSK